MPHKNKRKTSKKCDMNMLGNKSTATYFPFFWHYKQSSSGRAHSLTFTYDFFVTRIFEDEGGRRRRVCVGECFHSLYPPARLL